MGLTAAGGYTCMGYNKLSQPNNKKLLRSDKNHARRAWEMFGNMFRNLPPLSRIKSKVCDISQTEEILELLNFSRKLSMSFAGRLAAFVTACVLIFLIGVNSGLANGPPTSKSLNALEDSTYLTFDPWIVYVGEKIDTTFVLGRNGGKITIQTNEIYSTSTNVNIIYEKDIPYDSTDIGKYSFVPIGPENKLTDPYHHLKEYRIEQLDATGKQIIMSALEDGAEFEKLRIKNGVFTYQKQGEWNTCVPYMFEAYYEVQSPSQIQDIPSNASIHFTYKTHKDAITLADSIDLPTGVISIKFNEPADLDSNLAKQETIMSFKSNASGTYSFATAVDLDNYQFSQSSKQIDQHFVLQAEQTKMKNNIQAFDGDYYKNVNATKIIFSNKRVPAGSNSQMYYHNAETIDGQKCNPHKVFHDGGWLGEGVTIGVNDNDSRKMVNLRLGSDSSPPLYSISVDGVKTILIPFDSTKTPNGPFVLSQSLYLRNISPYRDDKYSNDLYYGNTSVKIVDSVTVRMRFNIQEPYFVSGINVKWDTLKDTQGPKIVEHYPARNAINVDVKDSVMVKFDEPLDSNSITADRFLLYDAQNNRIPSALYFDPTANRITLKPLADLDSGAVFRVEIFGIMDSVGNGNRDSTWAFTTAGISGFDDLPDPLIKLKVFPNPVPEELNIHFDNNYEQTNFTISNILGIPVRQGSMEGGQEVVSLIGLPSGVYFVVMGRERVMFVKE